MGGALEHADTLDSIVERQEGQGDEIKGKLQEALDSLSLLKSTKRRRRVELNGVKVDLALRKAATTAGGGVACMGSRRMVAEPPKNRWKWKRLGCKAIQASRPRVRYNVIFPNSCLSLPTSAAPSGYQAKALPRNKGQISTNLGALELKLYASSDTPTLTLAAGAGTASSGCRLSSEGRKDHVARQCRGRHLALG